VSGRTAPSSPIRTAAVAAAVSPPRRDLLGRLALSLVAAVLEILGFVGFGLFPLAWIALVPVLLAIRGQTPRRAFGYALLFGAVANMGGYYWVAHMLTAFGGIPRPLAWLGLVLLCVYQGAMFALLLWGVRRAETTLGLAPLWTLAVAYPALEFAYPLLFPYSIGASQYRFTLLTQVVDVTGLLGLTVLIGLVNGAVYELVDARLGGRRPAVRRLAVPALLVVAGLAYGLARMPGVERASAAAPRLKVALVQSNLGAREKDADPALFIGRHQAMSRTVVAAHPDLDLVVWPETAYTRWLPRGLPRMPEQVTGGVNRPLLFGALTFRPRPDGGADTFNTAYLVSAAGEVLGHYDKIELLLFGERIPLVDTFPTLRSWFPRTATFTAGQSLASLRLGEVSFLPMICYEDILPAFVRRLWHAGHPASVLVNLTNDSWYGDSHEPLIHLALATFRTIETRRALIRATNTGISALVDPLGRIVARTGQWRQETLVGEVPVIAGGSSTVYMQVGDVVAWLAWAGVIAGAIADRRRAAGVRRTRPGAPSRPRA
jgi:apolipoprotein N-acyltransferase